MLLTIVMMALSTGVMVLLHLVWLDHPEVGGVTPDGPASSSSCWECWEAIGCCDDGGGQQQAPPHLMGHLNVGHGTVGPQLASGPVVTQ